jgi:hypothetical protein
MPPSALMMGGTTTQKTVIFNTEKVVPTLEGLRQKLASSTGFRTRRTSLRKKICGVLD